jgi:hypothetical protein
MIEQCKLERYIGINKYIQGIIFTGTIRYDYGRLLHSISYHDYRWLLCSIIIMIIDDYFVQSLLNNVNLKDILGSTNIFKESCSQVQ